MRCCFRNIHQKNHHITTQKTKAVMITSHRIHQKLLKDLYVPHAYLLYLFMAHDVLLQSLPRPPVSEEDVPAVDATKDDASNVENKEQTQPMKRPVSINLTQYTLCTVYHSCRGHILVQSLHKSQNYQPVDLLLLNCISLLYQQLTSRKMNQ